MKKIMTLMGVAMVAGAAQATLWSADFTTAFNNNTWYKDIPQGTQTWADGDVYPGDLSAVNGGGSQYGIWGTSPGESWVNASGPATGSLSLNGHNNDSNRGAGVLLSNAEIGSGAIGTLTFDAVVDGHAGTLLYVEIWEAKEGTLPYYMDLMGPNGTAPSVKSWGDAVFSRLDGASYTAATDGTGLTVNFTRTDTTADVVVMFGHQRTADWWNNSDITNLSVEVIPEPATLGLVGAFGAGIMMVRRRFLI